MTRPVDSWTGLGGGRGDTDVEVELRAGGAFIYYISASEGKKYLLK